MLSPGDIEVACWPFAGHGRPGLATVDVLARLALAARRSGCSIRLRDANAELAELLELSGLHLEIIAASRRTTTPPFSTQ